LFIFKIQFTAICSYADHDAHSLTNPAERRSPRKSPRKNMNPHSLVSQAERHSPRKSPSKQNVDGAVSYSLAISRLRSQNLSAPEII